MIADLHIHSKYSRATSGECVPEYLDLWARKKGIDLLGTGDFTHPAWREDLKEKLRPAEEGFFILKEGYRKDGAGAWDSRQPRFVISGEISSIYKKNGKVRKIHNLILLPGIEEAETVSHKLEAIGNLHSDGRPILGLDSRDLLEIVLEACPTAIFIPAHIWTPHFSLFGAFSGFDTIEECFGDLTPYIHALETGLSSDPPMNWRLSALDGYHLVSNSDAHSPSRLGREANLFHCPCSYPDFRDALEKPGAEGLDGTIEFFPEEGKYHWDGHRNCQICYKPSEAEQAGGTCPVCGKRLTIGVLHRVEQLADRPEGEKSPGGKHFERLVPLPEVIAASAGRSAAGVKVQEAYEAMLRALGSEFHILRDAPLEDIRHITDPCIEEGIRRVRCGLVRWSPGYDGEYGKLEILDEEERDALTGQISLFGGEKWASPARSKGRRNQPVSNAGGVQAEAEPSQPAALNEEQQAAVMSTAPVTAVIAGPGTGKTKTLVSRIAWLVEACCALPGEITAVTFTNKAAKEMKERLETQLGNQKMVNAMHIGTFHGICLQLLTNKEGSPTILDENGALAVAEEVVKASGIRISPRKLVQEVSRMKCGLAEESIPSELYDQYCKRLEDYGVMDYDDLLIKALELSQKPKGLGAAARRGFTYLLVDEFQDISNIQLQLIKAWNALGKSMFVIGDPDQSIYGFRGADSACFDHLREQYPDMQEIRLKKNYRSTPEILLSALPVISHGGEPRVLEPQRKNGTKVRVVSASDGFAEGIFLAKEINRLIGGIDMLDSDNLDLQGASGPVGFADIAVLYRTHRQAEVIEKCLRTEGIPYIVTGREESLQEKEAKGTIGFFRYLLNPWDRVSLRIALETAAGCPPDLARQVAAWLIEHPSDTLASQFAGIEPIQRWQSLFEQFHERAKKEKPVKLLASWADESGFAGSAAMDKLLCTAVFYRDTASFLQDLSLGQEGDLSRGSARRYTPDAVSLMTFHGAKGLEFPVVFLSGIKKGIVPLDMPGRGSDFDEERRLFYVGMTRAKDSLIILTSQEASPFLGDMPKGFVIEKPASGNKPRQPSGGKQLSLFD